MSYILEALKKADAERDRGAVPDLHAQAMLPEAAFEGDPAGRSWPWLWLLSGVGLALIAGVAWHWTGSEAPAVDAATTATPPIAMPTAAAPTPPASMAASSAAALPASGDGANPVTESEKQGVVQDAAKAPAPSQDRAKEVAPTRAEAPQERPEVGAGAQPSAVAAKSRKAEANSSAEPRAAVAARTDAKPDAAPASKSSAKAPAKASPPQAAAERVPLLTELPDDVRRQVPALKLGGLVYSAAPASRMVIVNGDVQREGSTVAPGLTLENIKPKSAVFSMRGQRFEVPM